MSKHIASEEVSQTTKHQAASTNLRGPDLPKFEPMLGMLLIDSLGTPASQRNDSLTWIWAPEESGDNLLHELTCRETSRL